MVSVPISADFDDDEPTLVVSNPKAEAYFEAQGPPTRPYPPEIELALGVRPFDEEP